MLTDGTFTSLKHSRSVLRVSVYVKAISPRIFRFVLSSSLKMSGLYHYIRYGLFLFPSQTTVFNDLSFVFDLYCLAKKGSVDIRSMGAVRTSEVTLISPAVIAKFGICLTNLSTVLFKF
jgi:hypothetical protein